MDNTENAAAASSIRPSGLRQPIAISMTSTTSNSRGLQELTDSQHNSRSQYAMPPPPHGAKRPHAGSGATVSQPDAKQRKTLVEKAGEYGPKGPSHAPALPHVNGNSIATLSAGQRAGTNPSSHHSRQGSATNFGRSVGAGARPASAIGKPVNFSKSQYGRPRRIPPARPATAMGHYPIEDEEEPVANGKQQNAWDVDERLQEVENQFKALKEVMDGSLKDRKKLDDTIELTKTRANNLEYERTKLTDRNVTLETEVTDLRKQVQSLTLALEGDQRRHQYDLEDKSRAHQHEVDQLRQELEALTSRLQRDNADAVEGVHRHYRVETEDLRSQHSRELESLKAKIGSEQQGASLALQEKDRQIQDLRARVEEAKGDFDLEYTKRVNLEKASSELSAHTIALEVKIGTLKSQVGYLESDSKQQSDQFSEMEARMQAALAMAEEAKQKLIKEETERRVLFNKYQELKGNIRVMCRVRPVLDESEGEHAKLMFPDLKTSTQIEVTGQEEKSSLGTISRKVTPFEFDRVFHPGVHNEEVFGEISQMVQSALDGYNVCIFCYGQTGSGKTYTMSSADGMIPRATHMIYDTIKQLEEKSWTYTMEGSFVEVYNEELHDLLTPGRDSGADGKKKLEIRHDEARKSTAVLNCKSVRLDSADKVETMLRQAASNRSVAATKANERSSRSHSVFILRLQGENSATGERCEGTLNLVDLAGSERLKHSGAEGERMRETQNINRSLSCLGDVIEALGRGQAHVPYRNSRLTHLLQYSLGGNSKTLMFVMVSPLEAHLKETVTSLKFAMKVNNTHIGTAKSTKKAKESM